MTAPVSLRAPFPWFGGKSRAAHIIWAAFGDVANFVEPFAGSLAVLLARPTLPRIETVNDRDAYVSNFWRAVQHDPEAVARWADGPVNEADLHARHLWLVNQHEFRERMLTDPDYFDAKIAGWWVWGLSAWLGSGWCDVSERERESSSQAAEPRPARRPSRQAPRLSAAGQGIHRQPPPETASSRQRCGDGRAPSRQIPFVGNAGRGVHRGGGRQLPELYWSKGIHSTAFGGSFDALCARLRRVRVCCGDWSRVVTDSVTVHLGTTGILLDPPYADGERVYAQDDATVSVRVREWALANGDRPELRIALCGYEGEHAMPATWQCVPWKAKGGYGNTRKQGTNENARRERVWLSPHCLPVEKPQLSLFAGVAR